MNEFGPWVAIINWGRWIAECPRPRCSYAYSVNPGDKSQTCADGCIYTAPLVWPEEAAAITTELANRPVEQDRNWAPAGHRQTYVSLTPDGGTVAEEFPNGQTVSDIRAENQELEQLPPTGPESRDELVHKANEALAGLGYMYDPDTDQMKRL